MRSDMSGRLQVSRKRLVEVAAVVGVYILFLVIGVYGGQMTLNVGIINPPDGAVLRSSPVELVARVTVRGVPLSDATATFTVDYPTGGRTDTDAKTDSNGIARLIFPAISGNYTWRVTATKEGYPKIVSTSRGFSVRLSLVVDALLPQLASFLTVSAVNFKARVVDMNGRPIQSANVTFYVDSVIIGSSVTDQNGIAVLSSTLAAGRHTWFASASKEEDGGVSDPVFFNVV